MSDEKGGLTLEMLEKLNDELQYQSELKARNEIADLERRLDYYESRARRPHKKRSVYKLPEIGEASPAEIRQYFEEQKEYLAKEN